MVRGVANSRTMKSDNEAGMHALIQLSPSPSTLISLLAPQHLLAPTYYQHILSFFHSLLKHSFYCFTLTIRSPPHQPRPTPGAYTHRQSPVLQPSPSRELFLFKDQTEVYRDLTHIAVWGRILPNHHWSTSSLETTRACSLLLMDRTFVPGSPSSSPLPLSLIILASILVFFSKFLC